MVLEKGKGIQPEVFVVSENDGQWCRDAQSTYISGYVVGYVKCTVYQYMWCSGASIDVKGPVNFHFTPMSIQCTSLLSSTYYEN